MKVVPAISSLVSVSRLLVACLVVPMLSHLYCGAVHLLPLLPYLVLRAVLRTDSTKCRTLLNFSISIENFSPGGRSLIFSICGPLGWVVGETLSADIP